MYPPDHPIRTLLGAIGEKNTGKFGAKLTFEDRCAILACCRHGIPINVISLTFDVHRRTISHIRNPLGRHYKDVRDREVELGAAAFLSSYMTEVVALRVIEARDKHAHKLLTNRVTDEARGKEGQPRKQASGKAGVHLVKTDFTQFTHRIEVVWVEADQVWGWRDMDGSMPDFITSFDQTGAKFMTSLAALTDAQMSAED